MHNQKELKHKQHFYILINDKRTKILALSEKTHMDKQFNTCEERLHIKTKISGQLFPTHAVIKAIVNGVNIEYHCTWIGTMSSFEYIYRVESKQVVG